MNNLLVVDEVIGESRMAWLVLMWKPLAGQEPEIFAAFTTEEGARNCARELIGMNGRAVSLKTVRLDPKP